MPKKVMVVDDNALNLELFTDLLEMSGFEVVQADSGEVALKKAETEKPDLILMDVSLPGLDGFEATQRLRQNPATAAIPVVALTAHRGPEHQQKAEASGCRGMLLKPIDADRFAKQVGGFIG